MWAWPRVERSGRTPPVRSTSVPRKAPPAKERKENALMKSLSGE